MILLHIVINAIDHFHRSIANYFSYLFSARTHQFESIRTPFSCIIPLLESTFFGVVKGSHVIGLNTQKSVATTAPKTSNEEQKWGLKPAIRSSCSSLVKAESWWFWTLKCALSTEDLLQPQRARRVAFIGLTKSENSTAGTESILGQKA